MKPSHYFHRTHNDPLDPARYGAQPGGNVRVEYGDLGDLFGGGDFSDFFSSIFGGANAGAGQDASRRTGARGSPSAQSMRGRDYERQITAVYLGQLNELYADWTGHFSLCPVLTVPADDLDFVAHPRHMDLIVKKIEEKYVDAAKGRRVAVCLEPKRDEFMTHYLAQLAAK